MIALARPPQVRAAARSQAAVQDRPAVACPPAWHVRFMALLPDIRRQLQFAFRRLSAERRDEALQEALVNALVAYRRLYEQGKAELAYATPLARYAVRQTCDGRQVACRRNVCETLSPYAQRKAGFTVRRLYRPHASDGVWQELLVEDRNCTPAQLAASRLDYAAWLRRLPRRKRRIASTLAAGETTSAAARKFRVTPGRISQLRRELAASWDAFHGQAEQAAAW